jgi:C1A family cysteine protease
MLIMQNHWGTIWGLKGFFLCPYDVWRRQSNLTCWYEKVEMTTTTKSKKRKAKVHQ